MFISFVSVEFDKVGVVVVFLEDTVRCLVSSDRLSLGESQTSCARIVNLLMVIAFCEVGLKDDWSSNLSVCVGFL